jgi:hypothetical protein
MALHTSICIGKCSLLPRCQPARCVGYEPSQCIVSRVDNAEEIFSQVQYSPSAWCRRGTQRVLALLLAFAILDLVGTTWRAHAGQAVSRDLASAAVLRIQADRGASGGEVALVRQTLVHVRPLIDLDFGVRDHPLLTVHIYASHQAFGRALHRLEGVWPQGDMDASGNVVHGVLPLGPPNAYLRHNLAHIYTEWVMDRLTHIVRDRQPSPAWLYDGIAEWEADRRSQSPPCHMLEPYLLPLDSLRSPQSWWRMRGGPLGGVAYCEAKTAAAALIDRVSWARTRQMMRASGSWTVFARKLQSTAGRQSTG